MSEPGRTYSTEEDLALVRATESDIRQGVSVFSFDIDVLKKRVRDDDCSQAFIQAHLYLDHVVTKLLSESVRFPRYLQLDRTGFAQKLQLVLALGLLPPEFVASIKVVNSIRNKIAHQLDYVVQPADDAKLRSTLPKGADLEDDGTAMKLPDLLRLLTVMADVQRQERAFENAMLRKHLANARVVLDGISIER